MSAASARERMRRPWTLRRRLVLGTVAILALLSIVIGVVSAFAVNASLMAKLDQQLTDTVQRFATFDAGTPGGFRGGAGGDGTAGGGFLLGAGLGPGAVGVTVADGTATGQRVTGSLEASTDTSAPRQKLVSLTSEEVTPLDGLVADGTPRTVVLGDLGSYRVTAVMLSSAGRAIVVGLPLSEVTSTVTQVVVVIVIAVLVGVGIAVLAGLFVIRSALRPLERVTATASAVSELPLERGGVSLEMRVPTQDADPRTEVGQVGSAFNRMLGHIAAALGARDASEQKLRTFVADASHELRTPLASIRGYAELTRRSGHDLPDDVVHALGRVESESLRMTSLVEDLLLLARLDDGRELERRPVDVNLLLADAVSDAHAAGQDHDWELQIGDEPLLVDADESRLHQVVVNLLANARVHTPAGTRVVASARAEAQDAVIEVVDDGPGIDAAVLPTVFERFARGDASRSRHAGSTGLGLAIVAAVVEAHDGTVGVTSEPGRTTFTVRIPLAGSRLAVPAVVAYS